MVSRLRESSNLRSRLVAEISRFGVVGIIAYVVDVGLFNLLMFAGSGVLDGKPLTAKAISVVVATSVSYALNRNWTFSHRGRKWTRPREYALFFALNGVGMLISLAVLGFSHYVLGLTSPLADNLSANVVGVGLGTLFRFWSYRRWVFPHLTEEPLTGRAPVNT